MSRKHSCGLKRTHDEIPITHSKMHLKKQTFITTPLYPAYTNAEFGFIKVAARSASLWALPLSLLTVWVREPRGTFR